MITQNCQVETLFSKLHSHSLLSTLVFRMVFERSAKPIKAPAQGSALHVQNNQTHSVLDDFSTVLTQYFGKSFFPFPSSPKTSNWQIPAQYFGCTKPTSSTCNICCSPAPCHVRETDVSLLPFWQVRTMCSKPISPLFGTNHTVSHRHKVFNQLQTNLPDTSKAEKKQKGMQFFQK